MFWLLFVPAGTILLLVLYVGASQKRNHISNCSCHPDRLSKVNIVSKQLRIGYSVYNTWIGRYIHTMNVVQASTDQMPHTKTEQQTYKKTTVLPVPYLEDNYAYLIVCHATGHVAVVDPGDAMSVEIAMAKLHVPDSCPKLQLTTILTTHGHWDHDGGNQDLLSDNPNLIIVGGKGDGVSCCNRPVEDNEIIRVGDLFIRAVWTPCHTPYHMCYHYESGTSVGVGTFGGDDETTSLLFSGDTLFVGGCGKFWEGDAEDMKYSLDKLKGLAPHTLLYCGHEYAVNNLSFNRFVEPNNVDVKRMLTLCQKKRDEKLQTVPTLLSEEYKYNSFLRAADIPLKVERKTNSGHEVDCLYTMRRAKDTNHGPELRWCEETMVGQ